MLRPRLRTIPRMAVSAIDRRSFLSLAASAAGLLLTDPERLFWTPKKTIFIPLPGLALHKDAFSLAVGDLITFEGKYHFNPYTRESTGVLQRFVVTATLDGFEVQPVNS